MTSPVSLPPPRPLVWRLSGGLFRAAASLRLAVVLIAAMVALLTWAALWVETRYGTEVVQFAVYQTWWFGALGALLALNVLAAMLVRFPWKRRQAGFVVVHLGILVLLAGSWWGSRAGISARVVVFEGATTDRAYLDRQYCELRILPKPRGDGGEGADTVRGSAFRAESTVADEAAEALASVDAHETDGGNGARGATTGASDDTIRIPFRGGPFHWRDYDHMAWFPWHWATRTTGLLYDARGVRVEAIDYLSDSQRLAVPRIDLLVERLPGRGAAPSNAEQMTLSVESGEGPHAALRPSGIGQRRATADGHQILYWLSAGPGETAAFLAGVPKPPLGPLGQIVLWTGGKVHRFDVEHLRRQGRQPLGTTGIEIELAGVDPLRQGVHLQVHRAGDAPATMVLFAQWPHFNRHDDIHGVYGYYWFASRQARPAARAESEASADDKSEPPAGEETGPARGAQDGEAPAAAAGRASGEDSPRAAPTGEPSAAEDSRPLPRRVDLLEGYDGRLYRRTVEDGVVTVAGAWPGGGAVGTSVDAFADSPAPLRLTLQSRAAAAQPGWEVVPLEFRRKKQHQPKSRLRLRVTFDGTTEEFWLSSTLGLPEGDERKLIEGKHRRLLVRWRYEELPLGFRVHLRDFRQRLDPGSHQASEYSSLVDFLPPESQEAGESRSGGAARDGSPGALAEGVLVTLNAPVDFRDPVSRRVYRFFQTHFEGPWKPGDPEYDQQLGAGSTRDELYLSYLSANSDPGRGLKYAGSALVVAGIAMMYSMRTHFFRRREPSGGGSPRGVATALLVAIALGAGALGSRANGAEASEPLDFDTLGRVPVFGDRMMPLDTFARRIVQSICGRERPTLQLDGAVGAGESDAALAGARAILPGGAPRRFEPVELLLSWLVEPGRWQRIPFLVAEHKQLREEILLVPPRDGRGRRLRHVSPHQVEQSRRLAERWDDVARRWRAEGEGFELSGVDRKVRELLDAYTAFRRLTFDPDGEAASNPRFRDRFQRVRDTWGKLAAGMKTAGRLGNDDPSGRLLVDLGKTLGALAAAADAEPPRLDALDAVAAELRRLAAETQRRFAAEESPAMAHLATALWRETIELHRALYDGGGTLRLVPALSLAALEATRTPDDDAPPWLSFQSLARGSPELLAGYPSAEVAEARAAFAELAAAYTDRAAADRPERFQRAAARWAAALRRLGEAVEPPRRALPLVHRDEAILAATAYPPPGATDEEVFYNQLDPFFWAWLVNLGALASLALSFGVLRRWMFWLGLAALLLGQAFVLAGLGLRWHITGLAPLTGMFETVVIAALCVALMGLAFTLLPLVWGGLRLAWRLTALPRTPEATDWRAVLPDGASPTPWAAANAVFVLPRVAAAAAVGLSLARVPGAWERGYFGYFSVLPEADASGAGHSINSLIVWGVSLVVLLVAIYLVPRVVLALAAVVATAPYLLRRGGFGPALAQVTSRKPFALVGAAVALLAALLAYYAPETVLSREITATRPILRDNFWLFVHVLTITASYAAGALAWGLANISLAYYLFGRYRPVAAECAAGERWGIGQLVTDAVVGAECAAGEPSDAGTTADAFAPAVAEDAPGTANAPRAAARCLPPEPCAALATFTYRAIQVAVLLLAAGTILGALWADKAWGRFWSWDAKEVFSLVSLLVYMAVLHGRYVGWSGNFGLAVGAVLGMTFIMIAWYGVNFIFGSGLHSYGSGAGGQTPVIATVVANWIFVGFAAARYLGESRQTERA